MNRFTHRIKALLDKPDKIEIAAYQHKMPQSIDVDLSYDKKTGYYTARVVELDGKPTKSLIITESKHEDDLVDMVNDAILTYLDVPPRIAYHMPQLLPTDIAFGDTAKRKKLVFAK